MVQVVMGEQRGEGVRMGTRCFWDADTDNYASETFVNVRATTLVAVPPHARTRARARHHHHYQK